MTDFSIDQSALRPFDQVREAICIRHYKHPHGAGVSAMDQAFHPVHQKRHPRDMGAPELTEFLSDLATQRNVAASIQNRRCTRSPQRAVKPMDAVVIVAATIEIADCHRGWNLSVIVGVAGAGQKSRHDCSSW
jgi:hypothetical protein